MAQRFDFSDLNTQAPKGKLDFSDLNSQSPSFLQKAENIAGTFNKGVEASRLPALAGGLLQGAGDVGASLANIPLSVIGKEIGKNINIPHPNLGQYVDNSFPSKIAFGAGEIGSPLGVLGKVAGEVGKVGGLTENLSKIPYLGRVIARPAEGAITGAAIGENDQGNRGMGAALGAGGNALMNIGKFIHSALPSQISNSVLKAKNFVQEKYSNLYDSLFDQAKDRGLGQSNVRVPKIDLDLIKDNATKKYWKSLEDFNSNPTLETAHLAQSDMGKYIRQMEKLQGNNALTSPQIKAYQEAINAQKKLRGTIFQSLTKNGEQDLANQYGNITQGYKRDVVPYITSKPITALQNKDINNETFANRIVKNDKFRMSVGDKHPEIAAREFIDNIKNNKLLKYGIGSVAAGALAGMGYKKYNDYGGQ